MSVLTASGCHTLQLPPIEKDDRLNLNVRTGSASTLYNSLVFTHGGLTIGLELQHHTLPELLHTFELRITNSKSTKIENYISGELFYLKLIDRAWSRVVIPDDGSAKPAPRLLHEICCLNNCVYLFGGLRVNPPGSSEVLSAANDLWEFNLELKKWRLLHDGSGWENDPLIPGPTFLHKMTPVNNLTFIEKKGHFGILIVGGKDQNSAPIYDNVVFDLVDNVYVGAKRGNGNLHLGRDLVLQNFDNVNGEKNLNVNYIDSIIVSVTDEIDHTYRRKTGKSPAAGVLAADSSAASTTTTATNESTNGERGGSGGGAIGSGTAVGPAADTHTTTTREESIIVYTPVKPETTVHNPLLQFPIGRNSIKAGRMLPTHAKRYKDMLNKTKANHTMPFNLKYPTGGLFGRNLVITGFLPGDIDISIFIFNIPTGIWSRLNVVCNHDHGSHRFWGGFAWQSHHKVVLLGNYLTLKTTSSIRFFTLLVTVSLPITNILASSELSESKLKPPPQFTDEIHLVTDSNSSTTGWVSTSSDSDTETPAHIYDSDGDHSNFDIDIDRDEGFEKDGNGEALAISFNDYVHYAAPKINFTTIRSVFPPAAVTLGRIALDRYGDLISDFEMISANGDRIPVSLNLLMERWGRYFIELLARGYVNAVDDFENIQSSDAYDLRMSKDSTGSSFSTNRLKSTDSKGSIDPSSKQESQQQHKKQDQEQQLQQPLVHTQQQQQFQMTLQGLKPKGLEKESPQFRLPFQDSESTHSKSNDNSSELTIGDEESIPERLSNRVSSAVDPHVSELFSGANTPLLSAPTSKSGIRKDSVSSFASANSLFTSHLQDIPPQLPLPNDPIPAVPVNASFRSSSRKLSGDYSSPRASLIHTLTVLRNIPTSRSPRGSPLASPRNSISGPSPMLGMQDINSSNIPNLQQQQPISQDQKGNSPLKTFSPIESEQIDFTTVSSDSGNSNSSSFDIKRFTKSMTSVDTSPNHSVSVSSEGSKKRSSDEEDAVKFLANDDEENDPHNTKSMFDGLLNLEDMENGKFQMEPSLIPRKLYIPFPTVSVKGFCEFMYTGQVGNKWLLVPTTLDNLAMAKFYKAPLLYDLISEVLFGIIGRKEGYVVKESKKLKKRYFELIKLTQTSLDEDFKFPLDEYEGLMDTVDDGYLDFTLLKKTSEYHRSSSFSKRKSSTGKGITNLIELSRLDRKKEKPEYTGTDIETDVEADESKSKNSVHLDDVSPRTGPSISSITDNINDADIEYDDISNKSSLNSLANQVSTSDDDLGFDLGYLEVNDASDFMVGPKSKSAFDKLTGEMNFQTTLEEEEDEIVEERERLNTLTLEQLVSPKAPVPPDAAIDLIYEMAAILSDMKLMLRAANARNMSRILSQWKDDLEESIDSLQKKYEAQQEADMVSVGCSVNEPVTSDTKTNTSNVNSFNSETVAANTTHNASSAPTDDASTRPVATKTASSNAIDSERISLKPTLSSTSLVSMRTNASDRSGSTTRGFTRFTPFTSSKKTSIDNNKELDKRITQMIKKDEKLKIKSERDEKLKLKNERDERIKLEKKAKLEEKEKQKLQKKKLFDSLTMLLLLLPLLPIYRASTTDKGKAPTSSSIQKSISNSSALHKKHGFFNLHALNRPSNLADDLRMTSQTSLSDTNSLESTKSSKSVLGVKKMGFFHLKNSKSKDSESSSINLDSKLKKLRSASSLNSQESKISGMTIGSSAGKIRRGLFSKK